MSKEPKKEDVYKETVFLPKTEFPMRGELPKNEPAIVKKWQDMDLYGQIRKRAKAEKRPKWVLHDGPPYANGHIHMGHAVNKILKDVVGRAWQMMGYDAPYVPGWDCHGLPIEWKIEEKYREAGKNKDEVDPLTFRAECRAFAQQWVDTQSAEFQRLGTSGDWKTPYLTMTNTAEGKIVREIHKFLQNGLLYRGAKPVMWSVVEKTALAEAEVEYKEHKSITVWVKFPVVKWPNKPELEGSNIVIWTTTPWTLPSNRAIAYGFEIAYSAFKVTEVAEGSKAKKGEILILADKLAGSVKEQAKIIEWEKIVQFDEADTSIIVGDRKDIFGGVICSHPLHGKGYEFNVPLLFGAHVTDDAGTGFVHIAPSHGADDFSLGKTNGLEITDNVTDDGKFREHVPLFAGLEVYTQKGEMGSGNFAVLKAMDEAGALLAKGSLRHEYPHSWRSKAPLIFRTTPQWFIGMDTPPLTPPRAGGNPSKHPTASGGDGGETLRQTALQAIKDTEWVPGKGEARIRAMIENRPDWCISRQRAWGVPIALFIEKKSGKPLEDKEVLNRIGDIFEAEGSDAWWSRPAQDFLGNKYEAGDYEQVFDIVDVWFESGSTHAFVLGDTKRWPVFEGVTQADLYLEGSDQHRGWFHSSLLESCGTNGRAPYKTVLTHGFVLDEKGYKMSKSAGNVISPLDVMEESGADILRLWTLNSDYGEDIRIGQEGLKATGDLYRRIRNTLRYLLGALDGFTEAEKIAPSEYDKLPDWEKTILYELFILDHQIRNEKDGWIQNYDYGVMVRQLHLWCTDVMSSFYFDFRKDRLYCDPPDSFESRAYKTVLCHVFDCLVTWLAPVLCFTTEEAWLHRPKNLFGDEESVHLRLFPNLPKEWKNYKATHDFIGQMKWVRTRVNLMLEKKRAAKEIGSSLEGLPIVYLPHNYKGIPDEQWKALDWKEIFITSDAHIHFGKPAVETEFERFVSEDMEEIFIKIKKSEGSKCERCWKVLPEVGEQMEGVCNRCADAVQWYRKHKKAA